MSSDPIGDMLAKIMNANRKFVEAVDMPSSKVKVEIAKLLKEEGFVGGYKVMPDGRQGVIKIYMKYTRERGRVLLGMKRVSRPGLRIYRGRDELPRIQGGLGVVIVSTPRGILSDKEARKKNVGGEIIAYAW